MEIFELQQTPEGWNFKGIDGADRIIQITGEKARRFADLVLHLEDLDFAQQCLDSIPDVPSSDRTTLKALWRSAVIHFCKCFGKDIRGQLSKEEIYKAHDHALKHVEFFVNLRNRNIVHDENSFARCVPGAAINDGTRAYKIEKIVHVAMYIDSMDQATYNSLNQLVLHAKEWVHAEYNRLAEEIAGELEPLPWSTLRSMPNLTTHIPPLDQLNDRRRKLE